MMIESGADGRGNARRFPPFVAPAESPRVPPIDAFLDELPSIAEFLADEPDLHEASGYLAESLPAIEEFRPDEHDAYGWAIADWQSFDWSSLGALGRPAPSAVAEADWTATEWTPEDEGAYGLTEGSFQWSANESSANEIASALNAIADRIRSGELAIDNLRGTPPEAAMAAALAALLKMRG
jgi:hypothetical protein